MTDSFAIIIPWRDNKDGVRARLWDYCKWRLEDSGIPYYVADDGRKHGQPFNISAARNRAFTKSREDIVFVMDADHIVQPLALDAVLMNMALQGLPWAPIFSRNGVFSFFETEQILRNELDPLEAVPGDIAPFCTSPLAIRREVWEDMGGQPEAYEGWGAEDAQFRSSLGMLHPIPETAMPTQDKINLCLFHQWAREDVTWAKNLKLVNAYEEAHKLGPEAVRAFIAEQKKRA